MVIWISVALVYALVPLIMIGAGWMMYKHPPKAINGIIGYRTTRSSVNQQTWDFAQNYAGRLWIRWGIWMLLGSMAAFLLVSLWGQEMAGIMGTVFCLLQCAVMVASIYFVEKALKENFDKFGNRREHNGEKNGSSQL